MDHLENMPNSSSCQRYLMQLAIDGQESQGLGKCGGADGAMYPVSPSVFANGLLVARNCNVSELGNRNATAFGGSCIGK